MKLRPNRIGLSQAKCSTVPDNIQGDSGNKVNILAGDSIGHCEKKIHSKMCLIVNSYLD